MEKYSPNWLLDKLNNSKTDAHKLMHIIDFQNNVGLHNVTNRFVKYCDSCEHETEHRIIHACLLCDGHL